MKMEELEKIMKNKGFRNVFKIVKNLNILYK
jgi:hypothetical protein